MTARGWIPKSHVRRFDHVGITVADLDAVTAFFVGLGLEIEGRSGWPVCGRREARSRCLG
jgi:hypothetical protein